MLDPDTDAGTSTLVIFCVCNYLYPAPVSCYIFVHRAFIMLLNVLAFVAFIPQTAQVRPYCVAAVLRNIKFDPV